MTKTRKTYAVSLMALICITALASAMHHNPTTDKNGNTALTNVLTDSISRITSACHGEIGVAIIINNTDTVTVNDKSIYPMMSVFKVHQALAICNRFDKDGLSLDTLLTIKREELDPMTWSPMMKEHPESPRTLPVKELLRYTLIKSDNNASNIMFERLADITETDSYIATLIPRKSFQIAYKESEMSADHAKAYSNYTSPLGAAILMNRLFTDTIVSQEKQEFIMKSLGECATGKDRIAAPLLGKEKVSIAHKTGSGYIDNGVLAAHNDVAYITLPNGTHYTLAIFVKDFKGNESQASKVAAHISAIVYSLLSAQTTGHS
ncbi:MAG: class A beta-lactamase, subclass A2 [Prevotella sp.]|nr:class A beta-lactamase, subclass A2 [Prevotella sp.]